MSRQGERAVNALGSQARPLLPARPAGLLLWWAGARMSTFAQGWFIKP
jgi:hypothetical protein